MYYISHIGFFSIDANVSTQKSFNAPAQILSQLRHCIELKFWLGKQGNTEDSVEIKEKRIKAWIQSIKNANNDENKDENIGNSTFK